MSQNDYSTPLLISSPASTASIGVPNHGWSGHEDDDEINPYHAYSDIEQNTSPQAVTGDIWQLYSSLDHINTIGDDINDSFPGYVSPGLSFLTNFVPPNASHHHQRQQQQQLQQQQPPQQQQYPNQNMLFQMSSQSQSFILEYVNYPNVLFKTQKRSSGVSKQIIDCGNLSFTLDFGTHKNKDLVSDINVKVKRTNESDSFTKQVGEVPLKATFAHVQDTKYLVKIDLDSVYEYNGKKVYELERSLTDEYNIFHLTVEVIYKTGQIVKQSTKGFKLVGKKLVVKKKPKAGEKRGHSGSTTSNSSIDSLLTNQSTRGGSGSPSSSIPLSPNIEGLIKAQQVVAEHIETKTLSIDGLHMGKTISTPNGDIGYTFPKEDKEFEEAEVAGLIPSEKEDGKYVITKLTLKNSKDAVLKGVITRSHYLEAMIREPSVPTEIICMMGIVPVQVVGSVLPNEAIYASPYHPGRAISGHHLDISDINEAAFIGYAFSARKTDDESSVGFVQAAVSVLETAGKYMLDQRLRDVEESFDSKIDNIQKSRKRSRKCVIAFSMISFTLLVLISIFLWQLLMPGSAYRYYVCKIGRMKDPEGAAFYNFIPYKDIFSYPRVNGIQFTFEKLMKKTHHEYNQLIPKQYNITSVNYYLNIDRCAYGGLRGTSDGATGRKRVFGADIFAVDEKCFNAYYYNENKAKWIKYNSVSWETKKNIYCNPPSKWKHFNETEHE